MDNESKGLGRKLQKDTRNGAFRLLNMIPTFPEPKTKMHVMFQKELDQGDTGTCVGHAAKHWEMTSPVILTKPNQYPTAFDFYTESCKWDEWTENDDPTHPGHYDFGSSILGLMKALQKRWGLIGEYWWAENATQLASFVSWYSPAIIGVNWYSSMFDVDNNGHLQITPNARLVGGHAICIRGYNQKRGAFRFPQSWGSRFGLIQRNGVQDGAGWIDGELMDRLISEDGEAALPIQKEVLLKIIEHQASIT